MSKKIVCLLLATILAVSVASCGGSKKEPQKENKAVLYEKSELNIGSEIIAPGNFLMNLKDKLVLYDQASKPAVYTILAANGTTEEEIKCEFSGNGNVFALDGNDNLYALAGNDNGGITEKAVDEAKMQIYIYNSKGEKAGVLNLGKASAGKGTLAGITDMVVDVKENIYLLKYGESIVAYDKAGKQSDSFRTKGCTGIESDGKNGIIVIGDGSRGTKPYIEKLDCTTGKSIWKINPDSSEIPRLVSYSRWDNCIYVMNAQGITKYDAEGKHAGYVFEFKTYNVTGIDETISGFSIDSSNNLYFSVTNSKDQKADILKFIPALNGKVAKKIDNNIPLTLSMPDGMSFNMQSIISGFNKLYPDIKIDIKPYDGSNPEARVTVLNTEFMAGTAPDILHFFDMSYDKYVKKGVFADLSEMMDKDTDFDKSKYNGNILKAAEYNGRIYVMPMGFWMRALVANKEILDRENIKIDDKTWTWEDFKAITQKLTKDTNGDGIPERYAFKGMAIDTTAKMGTNFDPYMTNMLCSNFKKFVDYPNKRTDFLSKEFIDILNLNKKMIDKKLIVPEPDFKKVNKGTRGGTVVFTISSDMGNYVPYLFGRDYDFNENGCMLRMPSGGSRSCTILHSYAINGNSKHKDEAWKFIKFLLSEKVQSLNLFISFPVNNAARKAKAEDDMRNFTKGSVPGILNDDGTYWKFPKSLTQEDVDFIDGLIDEVTDFNAPDAQITKIVDKEVEPFFAGQKTAEEVAKVIQNKVSTYLGE